MWHPPWMRLQKHPHVRGEDWVVPTVFLNRPETPPRAWGRQNQPTACSYHQRNTPTCVGKTLAGLGRFCGGGKHPHVRGEDVLADFAVALSTETPPRAWGRPPHTTCTTPPAGNTPTCVGKTGPRCLRQCRGRKHPHVRGEDTTAWSSACSVPETPPRAWGRLGCEKPCAWKRQKHPHVRGEDNHLPHLAMPIRETPPRAWGRRNNVGNIDSRRRNTPTCVGKTLSTEKPRAAGGKHPHVRGEDSVEDQQAENEAETPPRAWGRHKPSGYAAQLVRNTPTCVGKTDQIAKLQAAG